MSRDTGSFICQSLSKVDDQSNGSRQELDDDEDGGKAAFLEDHDDDDGDDGQAAVIQDIDNDGNDSDCINAPYTPEAQFSKARPLTFKNFMDYCHDFASANWKKPVDDRELYAGLIIGLTEEANEDDDSISHLVKTYKQSYNDIGPCSHLQEMIHLQLMPNSRVLMIPRHQVDQERREC